MRNEHRLAPSLMESRPATVCVPVCVSRASELARAIKRAAKVADIIELLLARGASLEAKNEFGGKPGPIWRSCARG